MNTEDIELKRRIRKRAEFYFTYHELLNLWRSTTFIDRTVAKEELRTARKRFNEAYSA